MTSGRRLLSAFSLVEVTLALGIASFSLLAILALLPASSNSNQRTVQQTADANLARAIAADLRATSKTSPPTNQNSPRYHITVPAPIVGTPTSSSSLTHTIFLREDGSAAASNPLLAQDADADPTQDPKYRAAITFTTANSSSATSPQRKATIARILLTWPALADKSGTAPPTNYTGSYEIMTALDRN
jgi:uncharacterized protein (TIGR02598 family)